MLYIYLMKSKKSKVLKLIKSVIARKNPKADVILFGSRARGQEDSNSDWDILILVDDPVVSIEQEKEYREELFDVELEMGEPISTFVLSKKDWETRYSVTPLYQNVKREGILL